MLFWPCCCKGVDSGCISLVLVYLVSVATSGVSRCF